MSEEKLLLLAKRVRNTPKLIEKISGNELEKIGEELERMFPPKGGGITVVVGGTPQAYLSELYGKVIKEFNRRDEMLTDGNIEIPEKTEGRGGTTARQVLAVHYLFEYLKVEGVDNSLKTQFIEFLTGKNYKNIYDAVCNPLATKNRAFRKKDLQFIRPFFEKLGLTEIVKMINNELDKPDK